MRSFSWEEAPGIRSFLGHRGRAGAGPGSARGSHRNEFRRQRGGCLRPSGLGSYQGIPANVPEGHRLGRAPDPGILDPGRKGERIVTRSVPCSLAGVLLVQSFLVARVFTPQPHRGGTTPATSRWPTLSWIRGNTGKSGIPTSPSTPSILRSCRFFWQAPCFWE